VDIAVVGAGWLGLPLAQVLLQKGHNIVTTARSPQKCEQLKALGLEAHPFTLGQDVSATNLSALFNCELLILNIPVGRNHPSPHSFTTHISKVLEQAKCQNIQRVLFVSTTSVYAQSSGVVTEDSQTLAQTTSAQINLATEHLVQGLFPEQNTVIRLAGLIGGDRHPAHFLAGRQLLANGNQVVNLVHRQDVICAITTIIQEHIWGQVLHLCATEHPTRKEYYTWAAKKLGLVAPSFAPQPEKDPNQTTGKSIDASYSLNLLKLNLTFASPYHMLGHE
jgi:nucleoside-diphosphate-sugar epimerase